jgi:GMP synthase-like glutamine amidotransferase
MDPSSDRSGRQAEYEYRFVRITDDTDPIFSGLMDSDGERWQEYTRRGELLRVWQNHGLQVDGIPDGFRLLATSFLCENQMMAKTDGGQMIYGVQFHLEKSFEDWNKNPSRWEHFNESRDGRILFENFLRLATRELH